MQRAYTWQQILLLCCPVEILIHLFSQFCELSVSVILYGCEKWPPTLREEHRLRVFENRVLRRIFGPKRDEETGG
jgi:hypothetical protein